MSVPPIKRSLSVKDKFKNLDLTNRHSLVFTARKGVHPKVFFDLAGIIKMPENKLASILNLSSRTLNNYKALQKNLEPLYSEHLLKLIALFELGENVFGNITEFMYWLDKPFWNAAEKPIDWINTPGGVDLLTDELNRLSQGYPI